MYLAAELRNFQHIVNSTTQFVDQIKVITPKKEHTFYKFGLKDYCMSGSSDELLQCTLSHINDPVLFSLLRDMLALLLHEQYVSSKALPGRLWEVIKGTGMGLVHSGFVSDMALHSPLFVPRAF